jgi:predicted RNA-binding protein YlqC (UPF0109 family)
MKELVEMICKSIVEYPEEVVVNQIDGEQITILELKVKHSDIRFVIGKHGRTISSIRTIINSVVGKHKKRYILEILEHV